VYRYAGLDDIRANELIVIGLFRYRAKTSPPVDYPLAVELHPDGQVMVALPAENGEPQAPIPYIEAGITLARPFCLPMANEANRHRVNFFPETGDSRLLRFAEGILTADRSAPTLVLLEADGWRHSALKISDNGLQPDLVSLGGRDHVPAGLPNTALLRVRDAGRLNETPQFIASDDPDWNAHNPIDDSSGMLLAFDRRDGMAHGFSVGRQPDSAQDQDNAEYAFGSGGDTAFRHQQAVEMLAFFARQDEDRFVFIRIAHLLRMSPAWGRGNTILPLPLHLARELIKDVVDVFAPKL
jgi:hypothetical protein